MIVSVLPVNVFAWSNKSHVNSANIILLEQQRAAEQNGDRATVSVRAPYDGDETSDTYSYKMPQEFQEAIFSYPDAFRAGSLGPDFYPDLIAGQMIIHPYEEGMSSGDWITVLCDSVNMLPKNSETRKEALAFTLGCMLHYCGDLFGHDFINTFSGGSFPAVMDVLAEVANLDYAGKNLNNVISHMSMESYMDKLVNHGFYNGIDYLEVDAPDRFVADTWVGNGSLYGGHTKLYDEYAELPPHFEYLIDWRTELYNEANEWRDNPDPTLSAAATKYLDRWVADQDKAIYALVETFDRIAARLVAEKDPDLLTVLKEEIKAWGLEYGIYLTGVPDWMIDFPIAIDDFLEMLDLDLIDLDELIEELIEEAFLNYMGIPSEEELKEKILNRLSDPSKQLDSSYNPYMQGEDNFAEFKQYMDKYAKEQRLLSGSSLSSIINDNDSGALDQAIDSDFEAFYNTMVMFKLILMGPDNFKTFVKELSGKTPTVYNSQKTTHIAATGVELEISTADLVNAGTDDDIYAAIVKTYDNGQKGRVQYKLLDKSYYNDFEAGDKDKYFVEFSEPVRLDRLEVSIIQKDNGTAGDFWKCDDITITPMHVGVALTDPISVGGNHDMDSERMWELEFQKALNAKKHTDIKTQNVTTLKVRIKTGSGTYPGTDSDIYLESYNGTTKEVWKSVLLDKPAYNDFEKNDNDTYIVPVTRYDHTTKKTEGIPLDQLKFRMKNSGSDEWYLYEMWVTPYNGNIQLTDTIHVVPDNHLEDEYVEYDFASLVKDSEYRDVGSAQILSYKTSLDDDLIKYVESIDGAAQWADSDNPLWKDSTIREKVFFKVFKGFRPEINYTGTSLADYNKPIDITLTFDAFWNGIRKERRDSVSDIAKMAPVEGVAKVYFINEKGTVVSSTQKTISNNKVVIDGYVDSKLLPGTYDVKIVYDASASNPMYADVQKTFFKALTVEGVGSAITVITANDVTTPIIGSLPVNVATTSVKGAGVTKIVWQYYDSNKAEWYVMPEGAVFEKGKRYQVTLRFTANSGYVFANTASEMTAFVNGNKAEIETTVYSSNECYVNMEYTAAEKPAFTVQPKGGEIKTGESLTVTWQTSFTPVKLALTRDGMTRSMALDATATSYRFASAHEKAYTITAFYTDSEYIVSEPFYITEASANAFTDVAESDWYYNDVKTAFADGLINGKSETKFEPGLNITYAEAIKLAACMHQLYTDGKVTLTVGNPWYQPYVDYCLGNNIIKWNHGLDFNASATREGYMEIFANALPKEAFTEKNYVPDGSIPDVPDNDAIYKLYRTGIVGGVDAKRNCLPDANIKRSEVAAVLTRMMYPEKRITVIIPGYEKPEEVKLLAVKTQPFSVTAKIGDAVSFKVEAEGGKAPYTYRWQVRDYYEDWEDIAVGWIAGAKDATLSFSVHQEEFENQYQYRCVITDANGDKVTSKTVNVSEKKGGIKDKFEQTDKEELKNEEFLMYVEDVFFVTGRNAVVATGRVIKGRLNTGDSIIIVSADGKMTKATVTGIEMFHKLLDYAEKGDNIGLQFSTEIEKTMVKRGDSIVSAKTNYMVSDTLVGTLTLLTEDEGGRRTSISDGYSPQFYCNATDNTGVISGIGTMDPGTTKENVTVTFKNFTGVFYIGQEITVREGGRTYGTFTVKEKR